MTTTTRRGRPRGPVSAAEQACRKVACPRCMAGAGEPCTRPSGLPQPLVHFARRELAVAGGHHNP